MWGLPPLGLGPRRVIAHRAMLEIDCPHAIINLGVGMPEVRAGLRSTPDRYYLHAVWALHSSCPCVLVFVRKSVQSRA